jgi:hypothetical protein
MPANSAFAYIPRDDRAGPSDSGRDRLHWSHAAKANARLGSWCRPSALANGATVVLEIKGFEDDQDKAKHTAAKRWVTAVYNWGQLGRWTFHVCRNPQLLDKEIAYLNRS